MTFGRLFIAPVIGASIGVTNRLVDFYPRFIRVVALGPNDSPLLGYDLNVHLLRIGLTF